MTVFVCIVVFVFGSEFLMCDVGSVCVNTYVLVGLVGVLES